MVFHFSIVHSHLPYKYFLVTNIEKINLLLFTVARSDPQLQFVFSFVFNQETKKFPKISTGFLSLLSNLLASVVTSSSKNTKRLLAFLTIEIFEEDLIDKIEHLSASILLTVINSASRLILWKLKVWYTTENKSWRHLVLSGQYGLRIREIKTFG